MKALENHKNAFEVLRLNADAVIAHRENPFRTLFPGLFCGNWKRLQFGRDADLRRCRSPKLNRIADEILEQLRQLRAIGNDHRKRGCAHSCVGFLNCEF